MFRKWLSGDMGTPGEYMYQPIHLYSTAAVTAVLLLVCFIAVRNMGNAHKNRMLLVSISIFQLAFEALWRLIYVFANGDTFVNWWPLYPCNLGGILIPLFAIMNWKTGKKMFYLFGFVGGCLTFAMPDGIFATDVMVFPVLKSILQHTGLLLIPALELVSGTFRPTLKDLGWVICGCFVHLLNCEVIDRWLGFTGDYMFFRSGMPFVIPGVPQWITLSVFALIVLAVLSFLCDIKGSLAFLKGLKKQAPARP